MTHKTHDEIRQRLEGFVDGLLDPAETRAIESHLSECDECTAVVADLQPVPIADLGMSVDDGQMRRTVRRAMGRTALDAAAIAVIAVVVIGMIALFVIQPLVLGRGGRAAVAARAAYEAPMLFNPGVSVSRFAISSGFLDRTSTSDLELQLGSGAQVLGDVSTRVGLFRLEPNWRVGVDRAPVPISDVLPGLGEGTVVTVHFELPAPLDISEAQSLADDPGRDVRLIWAGFDVASSSFGVVGNPLCRFVPISDELFGAWSAGAGGTIMTVPASFSRALESARTALALIASNGEVADALAGGGRGEVELLAAAMAEERRVTNVVVTGPTPEVVAFLDDLGIADGAVLAVGFYSWGSPVCGM